MKTLPCFHKLKRVVFYRGQKLQSECYEIKNHHQQINDGLRSIDPLLMTNFKQYFSSLIHPHWNYMNTGQGWVTCFKFQLTIFKSFCTSCKEYFHFTCYFFMSRLKTFYLSWHLQKWMQVSPSKSLSVKQIQLKHGMPWYKKKHIFVLSWNIRQLFI